MKQQKKSKNSILKICAALLFVLMLVMSQSIFINALELPESEAESDISELQIEDTSLSASASSFIQEEKPEEVIEKTAPQEAVYTAGQKRGVVEDVVPDPELLAAINMHLGQTDLTAPVSSADLEELTGLSYSGDYENTPGAARVTSLEGLQYAINLTYLDINYADLRASDVLAPIQNLTKLTGLSFINSRLSQPEMKYVSKLVNLEYISLDGNNITNFNDLKPLFAKKLSEWEAYEADPENQEPPVPFYHSGYLPLNDLSGMMDYLTYRYKESSYLNTWSSDELQWMQTIMYVTRGIGPNSHSYYSIKDAEKNNYWGFDIKENNVGTVYTSSLGNTVPVKTNITDYFGDKALFAVSGDWHMDLENESLNLLYGIGIYSLLDYMEYLHDSDDGIGETVEEHFALKSRPSAQYPGKLEYYYEGRYFNIVPYNPYATGSEDFQDIVIVDPEYWTEFTVFYYEYKNIDTPVENPEGGYYPSPYVFNGDSVTAVAAGFSFIPSVKSLGYNSGGGILFSVTIKENDVLPPYITGAKDATIAVGSNFDPLEGVLAFDPNSSQSNPANITDRLQYSGQVDVYAPGTYSLTHTVVNDAGLSATASRVITVAASVPGGIGNPQTAGSSSSASSSGFYGGASQSSLGAASSSSGTSSSQSSSAGTISGGEAFSQPQSSDTTQKQYTGSWSIISLGFTFITLLLSLILIFDKKQTRLLALRLAAIWVPVISVPVFLFTNQITQPMVIITPWTLLAFVIFAAQSVLFLLYARKRQ